MRAHRVHRWSYISRKSKTKGFLSSIVSYYNIYNTCDWPSSSVIIISVHRIVQVGGHQADGQTDGIGARAKVCTYNKLISQTII